ncbi:MAG TPA: zinc ribbon domain-containing protein [Verrucomicrobiae bacterium]|nr:zinc ribbon domain-containing protein [Verrucomicrobiae bacterium]
MPIYEFACPQCRVIYSFLSKRVNPERSPSCPKCGNKKLARQMSHFAALSGSAKSAEAGASEGADSPEEFDDPRTLRAMSELERDMEHLDENNPRHMAHMIRRMKDLMPPGTMPAELDTAIKRLEAGEDPEKIEEDMGPILEQAFGTAGGEDEDDEGSGGFGRGYTRDSTLYDY